MEAAVVLASLKVAYHLLVFGIQLDQVPAAVRRCLELVRTCHYDLEDLIKLRNENLRLLETKPAILERVNVIISNAHNGLLDVCRVVEKLRPAAHDGRTPLMNRLEWMFVDSRQFTSQEPLVSRQHSSVIAELNFLRQLVLMAPLVGDASGTTNDAGEKGKDNKRSTTTWENVAILDEMLGGGDRSLRPSLPNTIGTAAPVSANSAIIHPAPAGQCAAGSPPPPPYVGPRPVSSISYASPSHSPSGIAHPQYSASSLHSSSGSCLLGNKSIDEGGLSLLFGDIKMPSSVQASIPPAAPAPTPLSTTLSSFAPRDPLIATQSMAQPFALPPSTQTYPSPVTANAPHQPLTPQPSAGFHQNPAPVISGPGGQPPPLSYAQHPGFNAQSWGEIHQQVPVAPVNQAFGAGAAAPLSTIPQSLIYKHDLLGSSSQSPTSPSNIGYPGTQVAAPLATSPAAPPVAAPAVTSVSSTAQIQEWRRSVMSSPTPSYASSAYDPTALISPASSAAVPVTPPWQVIGVTASHNSESHERNETEYGTSSALARPAPTARPIYLGQMGRTHRVPTNIIASTTHDRAYVTHKQSQPTLQRHSLAHVPIPHMLSQASLSSEVSALSTPPVTNPGPVGSPQVRAYSMFQQYSSTETPLVGPERPVSTWSQSSTATTMPPTGVAELVASTGSMVQVPTNFGPANASKEIDSFYMSHGSIPYFGVESVTSQPQELSSVVFAPDPVELE